MPASSTWCWARPTRPAVFESEFGDGSKLGLQIDYVVEDEPLGTGGGIANVAPKLRHDTAMVFNGDVLSGADLGALLDCHESNGADVTLHLVRVGDPRAFGCVPTDADGRGHRLPGEDRRIRRPTRSTPAATCSSAR